MLQVLLQKSDEQDSFKAATTAALRNAETQVRQLATFVNYKPQGALPSDTKDLQKEQLNAITTRSGKTLIWAGQSSQTRSDDTKTHFNEFEKNTNSDESHLHEPPTRFNESK